MKKQVFLLSLFALFVFTACESDEGKNNARKECQEIVLSRAEQNIVNAESDYAFDLVSKLYEIDKENQGDDMNNIFVSPLSMFIDFSMLANGGSPEYQNKIIELLKLEHGTEINELNSFNNRIVQELLVADRKVEFKIANSIWTHTTIDLKRPFVEKLMEYYDATASSADFDSKETVDKINKWANSATKGLIPRVFKYGELSSENVFALCNALYFNGKWVEKIDDSKTKDRVFYNQNGAEVYVPTMETGLATGIFMDKFAVLKKGYGNGAYSIYFVLPDEGVSLGSVMADLNMEKWTAIKNEENRSSAIIRFPKFKVNYKLNLSASEDIESLGINEILGNPDLSKMSEVRLSSLKVIQNNTMEVDESGSKAAVVSVFTGDPTCPMPSDPLTPIDINRPFMFLIEEYSTGTILFAGTILNL